MSDYLPRDVRAELAKGQRAAPSKAPRIRIVADGAEYPALRRWARGFAMSIDAAPGLRGRVDVYEGPRLICKALVVASQDDGTERHFEYKFATPAGIAAPPVDFARDPDAPVALLP